MAADMRAIAKDSRGELSRAAVEILPLYNAELRTTCVPTMIEGRHAPNAYFHNGRE